MTTFVVSINNNSFKIQNYGSNSFGKWRVFNNPFDRKDYEVVEKWGKIKANAFRGVIIAKSYSYKKDIISALNSVPLKIN